MCAFTCDNKKRLRKENQKNLRKQAAFKSLIFTETEGYLENKLTDDETGKLVQETIIINCMYEQLFETN